MEDFNITIGLLVFFVSSTLVLAGLYWAECGESKGYRKQWLQQVDFNVKLRKRKNDLLRENTKLKSHLKTVEK
jgi:hypothetical protein